MISLVNLQIISFDFFQISTMTDFGILQNQDNQSIP